MKAKVFLSFLLLCAAIVSLVSCGASTQTVTVKHDFLFPTLEAGDKIIIRAVNSAEDIDRLKREDVIVFWYELDGEKQLLTLRIWGILSAEEAAEAGYSGQTKTILARSDHSTSVDCIPVKPDDIVGVWEGEFDHSVLYTIITAASVIAAAVIASVIVVIVKKKKRISSNR